MSLLSSAWSWLWRREQSPAGAALEPVDCTEWRQGDVFQLKAIWLTDAANEPFSHDAPHGVAVVSQSCDAALPGRPTVQIAPVSQLSGDKAAEARNGKRISYAHLPQMGPDYFADLDNITTIRKSTLAALVRTPGVAGDKEVRRLAGTIARKFGRFAFPDEVIWAIDPMRDALRSKARKDRSPLGQALAGVYGIRVEAQLPGGWENPPYYLNLVVVFEPGYSLLNPLTSLRACERAPSGPKVPSPGQVPRSRRR